MHVNNLEPFSIAETVNADNYNAIINGICYIVFFSNLIYQSNCINRSHFLRIIFQFPKCYIKLWKLI